jgi:hypothetical protein
MEVLSVKGWIIPAALLVLFLLGCTSVRLGLDYDSGFDFSGFTTFSLRPDEEKKRSEDSRENPLMDTRIRDAVKNILSSRGYVRTTPEEADFLVGYDVTIEKKLEVNTVSAGIGFGGHSPWGSVGFQTSVSQYDEGTIIIDILDRETERLVWRGSGSRRVRLTRNPEKTTKMVNRAVSEILAQFPPKR